jgi:hypothetical protein
MGLISQGNEEVAFADRADVIKMSFSGQDADVYAFVPGPGVLNRSQLVHLDALQTLTVSVFREKVPVRAIGYGNVIGHTRGPRTIAGSMIYTVLGDHPLKGLFQQYIYDWTFDGAYSGSTLSDDQYIFPDVIPPFHVIVQYQNELGNAAALEVLGIDITNDGLVTSIEDLITEKAIQFRARDVRVFKGVTGANGKAPGELLTLDEIIKDVNADNSFKSTGITAQKLVKEPTATTQNLSSLLFGTKK